MSPDNRVPEIRYLAELVTSSPDKEPKRPQTRLQSRKDSWVYPDPTERSCRPHYRGRSPLAVSPDNGVPEMRYLAELVPSSPSKEPKRPQTRLQSRKDSWVFPDPNVFSDSHVEVGAVPGRRAAGSTTTTA